MIKTLRYTHTTKGRLNIKNIRYQRVKAREHIVKLRGHNPPRETHKMSIDNEMRCSPYATYETHVQTQQMKIKLIQHDKAASQ